jgi:two-component system cell cycle response regulator DivK
MHKILVVDDEADVRNLLIMIFRDAGYTVLSAENGEEAVRIAREELPDLIFMDILMPIMDGYQACSLIKSDPLTGNAMVVFLTAKDMPADWDKGLQSLADVYIAKPFSSERLLFVAKELLAIRDSS